LGPNFCVTEEIASVNWSNIMFNPDERLAEGAITVPEACVKEEARKADGATENAPAPAKEANRPTDAHENFMMCENI
jgi:hypothetical protein